MYICQREMLSTFGSWSSICPIRFWTQQNIYKILEQKAVRYFFSLNLYYFVIAEFVRNLMVSFRLSSD